MRTNRILQVAALSLALSAQVLAASSTSSELYDVEILIFQNDLTYLEGEELWTRDVVDTKLPGIAEAANVGSAPARDSDLSKAALILEAEGNYHVLVHRRWRQPADPRSQAEWLRIKHLGAGTPELEGTLRFYQGRYLHLDIELLLREPEAHSMIFGQTDEVLPKIYRISEHRRIRSRDVNYFDHPKFGALVQVLPVQQDR